MTIIACKCGWLGIAATESEVKSMHTLCDPVMVRSFGQSRMASDGMSQILSEAKWKRSA